MNLKEALKNKLTDKELSLLHRSFDVIGNIAIIDVPSELKKQEKLIAGIILTHKNITTVLKKAGKVKGRLRTRKLQWVAGKKTKETVHKESNCRFKLNVETCYFSPRLSNDRLEIAKQVKAGEKVLCLFSGVGPYPIVIAKNSKAKKVYGVELSREASKYAKDNIKLNKLTNLELIQGDVKRMLPRLVEKEGKFDRIVMARPQLKDMFLQGAFAASKKGTAIHLHDFLMREEVPNLALNKIEWELNNFKEKGGKIKRYKLLCWKKAGDIGPGKFRIRFDFVVR